MRALAWIGIGIAATTVLGGGLLVVKRVSRVAGAEVPLPADIGRLDPDLARVIREAHDRVLRDRGDAALWGELGMLYEANSLGESALECYAEAAAVDPQEARWPYRGAVTLAKLGRIADAARSMEAVARREGAPARAHWRLGFWRLDLGAADEALSAFERATRIDSRDVSGWIGLGRAHLHKEEAGPAIDALRQALAIRPDDRYAHFLLGTACRGAGRDDEARAELALGREAAPAWPDTWEDEVARHVAGRWQRFALAKALLANGQAARAASEFEALLREHPRDVGLLNNLALAYAGGKAFDRARATLEEAARIEPDNALTHLNLAVMYSQAGWPAEALSEIERSIGIDPRAGRAHELKGQLLRGAGRLPEALASFRREMEIDQRNPQVREWIAQILLDLGRNEEALAAFEESARITTAGAYNRIGVAFALMRLGRLDEAEATLSVAARIPGADAGALKAAREEIRKRRGSALEGRR